MSFVRSTRRRLRSCACLALIGAAGAPAVAQDLANFQVFQTGFREPAFLASPPGEPNRIMVGELRGMIHVIENGVRLATPFLDIRDRTRTAHGIIGVAFPLDYAKSRRFYLNYTPLDIEGPRIARFTTSAANPNIANTIEENLLETGVGSGDHNSGWMGFGPDGYLYAARGDLNGIPQSPYSLQGKILRLDVSPAKGYAAPPDNPYVGKDGLDEIGVVGVRNPWRNTIDSLTGDLYIADVGNLALEEISYVPHASIAKGVNLGWPCMEGSTCVNGVDPCSCDFPPMTTPVYEYTHTAQGLCVIGGPVYRGSAIPRWRGRYFFTDLTAGRVTSFRVVNGVAIDLQEHRADLNEGLSAGSLLNFPIAWGTDGYGEIYILEGRSGRILKLVPEFTAADWDLSGAVNSADFFDFLGDFFQGSADMTGDHATTSQDFFEYLGYFFK